MKYNNFKNNIVSRENLKQVLNKLSVIGPRKMYIPWILFLFYLSGTIFLNFFGPWKFESYNTSDKINVLAFIMFFSVISSLSYITGIARKNSILDKKQRFTSKQNMFLKISIWISIILYLFLIIEGVISRGVQFNSSMNLIDIISDAYFKSHNNQLSSRGLALTFYILLYYILFYSMVIGFFNFKKLNTIYKVNVIIIYALNLIYNVLLIGSNKGFGDIIIIVFTVLLIKINLKETKINYKGLIVIGFISIFILYFFGRTFMNRYIMWGDIESLFNGTAMLDIDNWVVRYFPRNIAIGISLLIYYLTHGYYGLSLTLKLPFVWTKGLGSSFAIKNNVVEIFNLDPTSLRLTYPERMEEVFGWDAYSNWHTIFPWVASDFTFIGSVIIISLFVYIYSICWKQILKEQSYSSIVLFVLITQLLLYIPANNQLFQTATLTIAFIISIIIWIYDHTCIDIFDNLKNN